MKKVVITSKVNESSVDALMVFLAENLANVRSFSGCHQVDVFFNKDTHVMVFDECWQTVEHHKQYIQAITDSGVLAELASFLTGPPKIDYFDRIDL